MLFLDCIAGMAQAKKRILISGCLARGRGCVAYLRECHSAPPYRKSVKRPFALKAFVQSRNRARGYGGVIRKT